MQARMSAQPARPLSKVSAAESPSGQGPSSHCYDKTPAPSALTNHTAGQGAGEQAGLTGRHGAPPRAARLKRASRTSAPSLLEILFLPLDNNSCMLAKQCRGKLT